jgi:very-short-patch-repair endonuclease
MRGRKEDTVRFARRLRVNQTDAETVLWNRIRNRQLDGHKFARQMPIGGYICDFVCREKQLVIEVDGGQHNESASDVIRDRRLNRKVTESSVSRTTMCWEISKVYCLPFRASYRG